MVEIILPEEELLPRQVIPVPGPARLLDERAAAATREALIALRRVFPETVASISWLDELPLQPDMPGSYIPTPADIRVSRGPLYLPVRQYQNLPTYFRGSLPEDMFERLSSNPWLIHLYNRYRSGISNPNSELYRMRTIPLTMYPRNIARALGVRLVDRLFQAPPHPDYVPPIPPHGQEPSLGHQVFSEIRRGNPSKIATFAQQFGALFNPAVSPTPEMIEVLGNPAENPKAFGLSSIGAMSRLPSSRRLIEALRKFLGPGAPIRGAITPGAAAAGAIGFPLAALGVNWLVDQLTED